MTYIGQYNIGDRVYSWDSPFAKELYYAPPESVQTYASPEGQVRGSIRRKRTYDIQNSRLLDVTDEWTIDQPGTRSDRALLGKLSGNRDGHLRETIATIQWDQYQQIAAAPSEVILLQGVAGSGKSIVGLHRIAYLSSPFTGQRRISPSKVAFFGPTRNFLSYVAHLLPSLDVEGISQRTVREWLEARLSRKVKVDQRELLLEKLLRFSAARWEDVAQAARLKGSLTMKETLDRHLKGKVTETLAAAGGVRVHVEGDLLELDKREVRKLSRAVGDGPLNVRRERLIRRIAESLLSRHRAHRARSVGVSDGASSELEKSTRLQVERQVNEYWPRLDFATEYRDLLLDPAALEVASKGRFDKRQSEVLAASVTRSGSSFQGEDLAALCYLDEMLNDRPNAGFEHVVVDEAQEVSAFEFAILMRHSRGSGFTILGDQAQSLSPDSAENWADLLRLFKGTSVARYAARRGYRSTSELTRFGNKVLKKAHPAAQPALPVDRHGDKPNFVHSQSRQEMIHSIVSQVAELRLTDVSTIGILCKTEFEAQKILESLHEAGLRDAQPFDAALGSTPPILVAPIYAVRGFEFDAVIVANASAGNYPDSPLHNRLLYLAVSRAAHMLHVNWFGKLAAGFETAAPEKGSSSKRLRSRTRAAAPRRRGSAKQMRRPQSGK